MTTAASVRFEQVRKRFGSTEVVRSVPVSRANGSLSFAGLPLPTDEALKASSAVLEAGVRPEDVEIAREPRPGFAPAQALTAEPWATRRS